MNDTSAGRNIKLFGERVLVEKVSPKAGSIFVPEAAAANDLHKIGRVLFVGTGARPGKEAKKMLVSKGDLVYFQVNAVMAAYNCFEVNGQLWMNLHQGDLIARLDDNEVTLEKFTPLGTWCLVKPYVEKQGAILLPDSIVKDPTILHWKLVKRGAECTLPIESGQEVLLNTGRCNLLLIERSEYGYIVEDEITGVVGDSDVQALAT